MISPLVIVSLVELLVGGVCLVIASLSWSHRTRPAGTPLFLLSLAGAGWAITAGVASLVTDPALTKWAQLATYAFVGPAAVCWFYVVVEYTGRDWWKRRHVSGAVLALVLLELVSIATDPVHHLYIAQASAVAPSGAFDPTPGPLLLGTAVWKTGLIVAGISLLLQEYATRQGIIKIQSIAIIVTGIVPMTTAILELLEVVTVAGLDFSVIGIAASTAIVLWALFYADFLDVVPIARETLLASMTDAVVVLDATGRVVDLNPSSKTVFDVDGDAIGMPVTELFAGRPHCFADDEYPAFLTDPRSVTSESVELLTEVDDEKRHYEINVSPIASPSGDSPTATARSDDLLGSLLVFRDVTRRDERETELEVKNARLQEFTSIVSHDLRNPLNVAQGRMELARETHDDDHFDAVARALDRMNTLIEDLLLLARKGQTVTDQTPVRLRAAVETCWDNVVTGDATLVVDSDQLLSANRSRFEELLENLLRNAVEHGGDDVTVTVGDLDGGRGFYFMDDGRGISETDRERMFEMGYSRIDGGTGLGLAIVDEIAQAHGWTIHVTESESGGTRFEFVTDDTIVTDDTTA
ncbi:MAG: histidine kinase N-terminal 7TM domain-containing protein [Halobacteriota archaeon]